MYFDWKKMWPTAATGGHWPVAIVGGGPIGLAMAQGLARQGIDCILIEARDQVSDGSRAIALTRRTMQILDALGVGAAVLEKASTWDLNAVHFGDRLVYEMRLAQPACERHRMTNLQQCWVEQILLDRLEAGGHADIRWQTELVGVSVDGDVVESTLRGADGTEYRITSDYLIAADGARGSTRRLVGLQYEGRRFEQQFVITDFHMRSSTEIGRRVWFSPPYARGTTVLQHRGPFDIWRLDYQLRAEDDPDEEVKPERVAARLAAHLQMIGETAPYEIIWTSIYRASALSLPTYRQGPVVFIGDAAHQIPIFGGRGINNGFMDVMNLSWKLGHVIRRRASERLLTSYSDERRGAILATIEDLSKVTLYMTTPSGAVALMRDAVLSLSLTERFVHTLFDPFRVPAYATLVIDATKSAHEGDRGFVAGPCIGQVAPDPAISTSRGAARLFDEIDDEIACLAWGGTPEADAATRSLFDRLDASGLPVRCLAMDAVDPSSTALALFDAAPGTVYLLRPDHHVAARWKVADPADVVEAIERALALEPA